MHTYTFTVCAVYGCDTAVKARNLCKPHYASWMDHRPIPCHEDRGGVLMRASAENADMWVCDCEIPDPEPIGMCLRCGMLVATFVHDDGELRSFYQEHYPVQYERARALGLGRA